MDGFNEKKWFVYLTDHHEGPFSLAEIQTKMTESQITSANYVWAEGMTDWRPMTEVSEFESLVGGRPRIVETEKTGDLDPEDLKQATSPGIARPVETAEPLAVAQPLEVAEPIAVAEPMAILETAQPMGVAEPVAKAISQEPVKIYATSASKPAAQAQKPQPTQKAHSPKKSSRLLIALALVVGLPTIVVGAGVAGLLDPVLKTPMVKASLETAMDAAHPHLVKLVDKWPSLTRWISPIPRLDDVSHEDYEILRDASSQPIEQGPKLAIALSNTDLGAPSFYVASNLPDGATIDVIVEGVPDTLLNQLTFNARVQAVVQRRLGKTGAVRFPDGKPMPRGEYVVYATEGSQQPDPVKQLLATIPPVTARMTSTLPRELKLLISKAAFLGGPKDAIYASRLKEFHDKLREKANAEVAEVKQLAAILEGQITLANTKYGQLRKTLRKNKIPPATLKAWREYKAQWSKLDEQLQQSFAKWTDDALKTDYFYGVLYNLTKNAGASVGKLHELLGSFFEGRTDVKTLEIQRGSAVSLAEGAIAALKAKIDQAEKLAPTPNGMPRREGL